MQDPSTEQYIMLKNALQDMQGDLSAAMSLLSFQPDHGSWWIKAAHGELRMMLVQGRLDDAESLGSLIATVLQIGEQGADDELAENRIHRETMRHLTEGIAAILAQDARGGLALLQEVSQAVYSQESLQWAAWFWIAKGAAAAGELDEAMAAGQKMLAISDQLDRRARSVALAHFAELEHLQGQDELALERLDEALVLFTDLDDERGQATAHLARARIDAAAGRIQRADASAVLARDADPEWDEPALFLARRALVEGNTGRAASLLEPWLERDPPNAQALQELRLVELLESEAVSQELMAQFCELRELPPSDERLALLRELASEAPGFVALREFLGWSLLKLGRDEEAETVFAALATETLDAGMQASVALGLTCLSNRRHRDEKTGARLRKMAVGARFPTTEEPLVSVVANVPFSPTELLSDEDMEAIEAALEASAEQSVGALDEWPGPHGVADGEIIEGEALEAAGVTLMPDPAEAGVDASSGASPTGQHSSIRVEEFPAKRADDPMPQLGRDGGRPNERVAQSGSPARAAFTGDLQLLAVPDLLEFLKTSRRTGTLMISSEPGTGAIHLRNGMITGAASPGSKSLGDFLVAGGALSAEQLPAVVAKQRGRPAEALLGSLIVAEGLADATAVQAALTRQVIAVIIEMLGWTSGRFAFEPEHAKARTSEGDIDIELDTQGVLLDALREFDELNK